MKPKREVKLVNASGNNRKEYSDLSKMFVHHVFFWLKEPENKSHKEKLKSGLKRLASIETIRYFHIGTPAGTDREVIDGSYQFSLLVMFDNKKGHDIYQDHKKHLEFISECEGLWDKVLVYDSWN